MNCSIILNATKICIISVSESTRKIVVTTSKLNGGGHWLLKASLVCPASIFSKDKRQIKMTMSTVRPELFE